MWNFFSRESFPYESTDRVPSFSGSVFSFNYGIKKTTGEKVSIFTYNKKFGNSEFLNHAQSAVKRLKTLKHPAILSYIDSYEDENLIHVVTNHCVPLFIYLKQLNLKESEEMYMKWGLATIGVAVRFLSRAELRHNNIFHGSIFVNDDGYWQLGELGYITPLTSKYPFKLFEEIRKYNPPEEMLKLAIRYIDNWGLGLLLWETFNGVLDSSRNLKPEQIPSDLSKQFDLLLRDYKGEMDIVGSFIESCTRNNTLYNTLDTLSNYHLKDDHIKRTVCKDLLTLLPLIPKDIVFNKILSLLKQAHEFDSDCSAYFVPALAKIPSLATEEKVKIEVEKLLVLLFSSNDRATRLSLLMNIEEFISVISKKTVNDIFPHYSAGFLDSNPKLRAETVKAMVFIAPLLNKTHLNDDAIRLLLQIQARDTEGLIRTNATICLGKIAYSLQPSTRKKVLLKAFLQALHDDCSLVRNAGAQAFAVTHRFFPIEDTAKNILPRLSFLTIDADSNVRENAFKTIKILLSKLEQVSQSPQMKNTIEKDVLSETCEDTTTWSGWALVTLTSKFLKANDTEIKTDTPENKKPATPGNEIKSINEPVTKADSCSGSESSDYDGWSDSKCEGWNDISEISPTKKIEKTSVENKARRNAGPMKLGTRIQK